MKRYLNEKKVDTNISGRS